MLIGLIFVVGFVWCCLFFWFVVVLVVLLLVLIIFVVIGGYCIFLVFGGDLEVVNGEESVVEGCDLLEVDGDLVDFVSDDIVSDDFVSDELDSDGEGVSVVGECEL